MVRYLTLYLFSFPTLLFSPHCLDMGLYMDGFAIAVFLSTIKDIFPLCQTFLMCSQWFNFQKCILQIKSVFRCFHWLNGHGSKQALGVGDGQGSLVCCSTWDCKESDTTAWLNWTDSFIFSQHCWVLLYIKVCIIPGRN